MNQEKVKLYTLSTCSHCKTTKNFLDRCTIAYDAVDVDLLADEERRLILDEVRKLNPRCTFPTIIIGNQVIVGFDEVKIKAALGISS